jgi:DNA-binding XRE family transcriptional regulator
MPAGFELETEMLTVKELRARRRWSQQHLANLIGASVWTIAAWEQGRAVPSVPYLRKLATAFEVSSDDIEFEKREPRRSARSKKES